MAGILLALSPRLVLQRYETATRADYFVVGSFLLGTLTCLGMSATYHTLSNHSEHVNRIGNQLDYAGIVFLIVGSFYAPIYYGLHEHPRLVRVYVAGITLLGAGTLVATLNPRFRQPAWRPLRAGLFVALGASAVFPVTHALLLYSFEYLRNTMGLSWLLTQGACYITGALIYACRIPEKYSPGTFDVFVRFL